MRHVKDVVDEVMDPSDQTIDAAILNALTRFAVPLDPEQLGVAVGIDVPLITPEKLVARMYALHDAGLVKIAVWCTVELAP
jgi:hypothetical protein